MRHVSILILTVGLIATACGKSDDKKKAGEGAGTEGAGEATPPAEAPPPYDGPLSVDRMQQAKDAVKPFQKWDQAYPRLLATVGEPTAVDGNTYNWYLLEGDKCHELSVENNNGEVGAVGLGAYDKIMKSKFDKCQATGDDGDDDDGDDEADEADEDDGDEAGDEDDGDEEEADDD